jgi:cyclic pyranopterin monophosphate synthase
MDRGRCEMTKMIDISEKDIVRRTAIAEGKIFLSERTISAINKKTVKKGDVLTVSQIAGIQAAKDTANILPLCHQIPLFSVDINFKVQNDGVVSRTTVVADYRTGVEMEALVGTTAALLSVWDMVKYLEKDKDGQYPTTSISEIRVLSKKKEVKR